MASADRRYASGGGEAMHDLSELRIFGWVFAFGAATFLMRAAFAFREAGPIDERMLKFGRQASLGFTGLAVTIVVFMISDLPHLL